MTVKTWDTSRVGGGTYELHKDENTGSYSLKSVGFAQVNKLNLPDLLTQDATTTTTQNTNTTQTTGTTDTSQPYKQLAQANLGDTGPDYSGVMLKTPEVKDVSVRSAGEMVNTTYNQMTDAEKNAIATGTATVDRLVETGAPGDNQFEMVKEPMTFTGATGTETYRTPRTIADQNKYLGRTFTDRTTGLQKIKATAQKAKAKIQPAISIAGKVLGGVLKAILPEESPTQKMNKAYFNVRSEGGGQRIAGNPATDLYAGMNRNSDYGNLERAGNKRISTREKTIAKRGIKSASNPKGISQKFVDDTNNMKGQSTQYKAKKKGLDTKNPNEMRNVDSGGGDQGSDSNTRVICTELHKTKEMSTVDWIRDIRFTYKNLSKDHIKGYLYWAVPTVKHIQKYPRYRKVWKHIAQHRANDIAWRLNQGKFDLLGRIYAGIGEPLCWLIGKCVSDKQLKELKLNSWRRA